MYFLLILVIPYIAMLFFDRKKAKRYRMKLMDNFLILGVLTTIVGVAMNGAGYEFTAVYDDLVNFMAFQIIASPFLAVRWLLNKFRKTGSLNEHSKEEIKQVEKYAKRINIVKKFNEKFNLNLTKEQIKIIVDSSYQCSEWADEINDMQVEYESLAEWYKGDTGFLRAYIKAFNIQEITSDFEYQRTLCLGAFDKIFSNTNFGAYNTIADVIEVINNKYLTNFDDLTFMIAYRFLEANDRKYILPVGNVVQIDSELESLKDKYNSQTLN